MKFDRSLSLFAFIMAAAMQFAMPHARGDNEPLWTFELPALPAFSDGSSVSSITTDVAGDTLIIIQDTMTFMNIPSPTGTQIFLLDGRGRLVASGDFPAIFEATSVMVSAKKAIISTGSGLQELTVGANKTLVATGLPFASGSENLANSPSASDVDRKFVHTSVTDSGKVTEIRCYVLKKLKPQPVCGCTDEEN